MKDPQMPWPSGKKKKHEPSKKLIETVTWQSVDVTEIRNHIDIDFTDGGHGYRYDYIPKDEIWIDSSESKIDNECCMVHEFVERLVMKELGVTDYDEAPGDFAAPIEQLFRDICVKKGIME